MTFIGSGKLASLLRSAGSAALVIPNFSEISSSVHVQIDQGAYAHVSGDDCLTMCFYFVE